MHFYILDIFKGLCVSLHRSKLAVEELQCVPMFLVLVLSA